MGARIKDADPSDIPVVTTSMTLIEAYHAKLHRPAWRWTPSRPRVEPVTEQIADAAIDLLQDAGLHGHKYAIDAALAAVALRQPGRRGRLVGLACGEEGRRVGPCAVRRGASPGGR